MATIKTIINGVEQTNTDAPNTSTVSVDLTGTELKLNDLTLPSLRSNTVGQPNEIKVMTNGSVVAFNEKNKITNEWGEFNWTILYLTEADSNKLQITYAYYVDFNIEKMIEVYGTRDIRYSTIINPNTIDSPENFLPTYGLCAAADNVHSFGYTCGTVVFTTPSNLGHKQAKIVIGYSSTCNSTEIDTIWFESSGYYFTTEDSFVVPGVL